MKRLILIALALATTCYGQAYMTVTASHIQDASGVPLISGQLCIQGVAVNGQAIPYRAGGGGAIHTMPVCVPVTNGVIPNTQIANSSATSPTNVAYLITVTDNISGNVVLQDGPTQISCATTPLLSGPCNGVSGGSTWNFDLFEPGNTPFAVIQTGPQGPRGPATTVTSNGANGDFAVIGALAGASVNQTFDVNGSPSTCTYLGITWNTKADCAYQAAIAYISANQVGAVLHIDAQGPYPINQQVLIPALTSTWQTLSILGDDAEASALNLMTPLSSGTPFVGHPDNAQLGRYRIANVRFNANGNATACMDLFGTNLSQVENVTCTGYTGDQSTYSHAVQFGDTPSNGNPGSFQTNTITNLQIIGSSANPTTQATATANWSGSALTFSITNGGAGYNSATAYPVVRGYGFLDPTTSFPTPCTTMPSNYAVTVVAGIVTAITPSNDYANCSGTFFNIRVIALPKNGNYAVNYALLCRACTDNNFVHVTTGSAGIFGARIEQGGNMFFHFHPISSIIGVQDYGASKWYGTELDSNWDGMQLDSASQVFGSDFVFNKAPATGWYDNAVGYFLNSSLTPGVTGATVHGVAMYQQPTTFYPLEQPAGPTTSGIPGGVSIAHANSPSGYMSEDMTFNGTALAKNAGTAFNSQKTIWQYNYSNNGSQAEKWLAGTNGPTSVTGGAPAFENFDFTAPSAFQTTSFDYAYRFGYANLAATSSLNRSSPYLTNMATYWDGAASQVAYCGWRVDPGSGTNPTTMANHFCGKTGSTTLAWNWRYTGRYFSMSAPSGGFTTTLDFAVPTASRTLVWPDTPTPFTAAGSIVTTTATSETVTVTGATSASLCTFSANNASAATAYTSTYLTGVTTNQVTLVHPATSGMTYTVHCAAP